MRGVLRRGDREPASSAYLEDVDVWQAVRSQAAAVDLQVLHPLNVDQLVAGHDALERYVAAHCHCAVGGQASLQSGYLRDALCTNSMGRDNVVGISQSK